MPDLSTFAIWLMFVLLLASTSIPFFVIGEILDRRERRPGGRCRRSRADRQPPPDHKLTKRERDPRAPKLKAMLLSLYESKYDFLLGVSNLRPSRRMGFYTNRKYYRITVHGGWNCDTEISIHEFAHHLVRTELPRNGKRIRSHGREFKTVYSILMDAYNRKYAFLQPDHRYYLPQNKRIKTITFNLKT